MTRNPLGDLVPMLAGVTGRPTGAFVWAEVTSTAPLRVRLATDPEPLPDSPLSLVDPASVRVGARALVLHEGTAPVLVGTARGGAEDVAAAEAAAWTPITLSGTWEPYAGFGVPSWRRIGDRVELTGTVRGSAGGLADPVGVLPPEARPPLTRLMLCSRNGTATGCRVMANGEFRVDTEGTTNAWVSLVGITFTV